MKTIISSVIGELQQDNEFEDWWESNLIEIPFFDQKKLQITYTDFIPERDVNFIKEADQALQSFLKKSSIDRYKLSNLAYQNCMDFLNAVSYDEADKPLWDIKDKNEIWNFIYPQDIYITRRHRRDKNIYLNVTCGCEWEQEHGLQLVFRQGKQLTRISSQDGHITEADAYDKLDKDDELLSQFESDENKQSSKNHQNKNTKDKSKPWWKKLWT